ncbi:MAG: DUF4037 domain-containing protein [Treponema sp.]|jgi:hypothetical protein|nr:DUF4037 domain-containing protein [Treponema sp.]HAP55558.1 hypothetical protein [Spirochaetaceae bacterium]HOI23064.1 hypothetical protein [Spirochaetales bacterium]
MEPKVEALTNFLKTTISAWNHVECITVDPRSEIFAYDPYFALVIDVYCDGKVPPANRRRDAFGDPGDFETAAGRTKDRFFLQEMPIRIEYKNISMMNTLIGNPIRHLKLLKNSGTYPFYRLKNNNVIYDATGWITGVRKALDDFPDEAWEALRDNFSAKMEHYLSDMGAASFSGDKFFLLLSESGFLRFAAASVFMVNRRFEPSHRDYEAHLKKLPSVPEGFWAIWDALLQKEREIPPTKRFEFARVLAQSVLSLG